MGAYMLVAFILGFWCIWASGREVSAVLEACVLTILAMVIVALMSWQMIELTETYLISWGILFVYSIIVFEVVNKFSQNIASRMLLALLGATGWFGLANFVFGAQGQQWIASFL